MIIIGCHWNHIAVLSLFSSLLVSSSTATNPSDKASEEGMKTLSPMINPATRDFSSEEEVVKNESNNRQQRSLQISTSRVESKPTELAKRLQQFNSHDALRLDNHPFNSNGKILESQASYRKQTPAPWIPATRAAVQYPQEQVTSNQARNWQNDASVSADNSGIGYNCHKQGVGRLFRSAKILLTDGFSSLEQFATSGNYIKLASSLLAAAVPIAAFVIPDSRTRRAGPDESSVVSRFGIQARVDSMMGWIERSVEHLPNFPRLHPQECVKRSICEAHNEPQKHGAIGFILRLFFPATNLSSTDRMDNMEYKVINKYRHAAGYGLNKRIDNNGTGSSACKDKYEDCLVSLLDVAKNLMDIFLK